MVGGILKMDMENGCLLRILFIFVLDFLVRYDLFMEYAFTRLCITFEKFKKKSNKICNNKRHILRILFYFYQDTCLQKKNIYTNEL